MAEDYRSVDMSSRRDCGLRPGPSCRGASSTRFLARTLPSIEPFNVRVRHLPFHCPVERARPARPDSRRDAVPSSARDRPSPPKNGLGCPPLVCWDNPRPERLKRKQKHPKGLGEHSRRSHARACTRTRTRTRTHARARTRAGPGVVARTCGCFHAHPADSGRASGLGFGPRPERRASGDPSRDSCFAGGGWASASRAGAAGA